MNRPRALRSIFSNLIPILFLVLLIAGLAFSTAMAQEADPSFEDLSQTASDSPQTNNVDSTSPSPDSTLTLSPTPTPVEKPNIVVFMIDDLAFIDHRVLDRLPNIKALFLDQGIEALNYWGNDPWCCPGRANFLQGRRTHHTGQVDLDPRRFDPRVTIATELQSVGYHTNICGKYLNHVEWLSDKTPPGWSNLAIVGNAYYWYNIFVNGQKIWHGNSENDYSTDVFAKHCADFISKAPSNKPLFILATPYGTHGGKDNNGKVDKVNGVPAIRHRNDPRCEGIAPWKPANFNEKDVSDKPAYVRNRPLLGNTYQNGYPLDKKCRVLLSVDDWVGDVVQDLKDQGRYENTIFIFTSDNGMGWGSHRWLFKFAPHTTQMLLYVSWPKVHGGSFTQTKMLLSNVDLAPTLCELAGCEMGPFNNGYPIDGKSFAGLIAPDISSSIPDRNAIIIERAIDTENTVPRWRGIITGSNHPLGEWLFVYYPGRSPKELYNISNGPCYMWNTSQEGDPCMLNSLDGKQKYTDIQRQLRRQLDSMW